MSSRAPIRAWVHDALSREVRVALERIARLDDVAVVAAMPDVHLAKAVCVGTVVATRTLLFPDAVGADVGCGMAALRFDADAGILDDRAVAARVLALLGHLVPTASRPSGTATLPAPLMERCLSAAVLERKKGRIARVQFATLGRGNHFVELQRDAEGALWLMVHSGSRGIGQAIQEHHGGAEGRLWSIPAASPEGRAYLDDLAWALDYARLGRHHMAEAAAAGLEDAIGSAALWDSYFDCQHNFVRHEHHGAEPLWVHRKGAISARAEELGIIPGSMGTASFHVRGRGNPDALCSSAHGAGRAMSRSDARRAISGKGLVQQMKSVWFDHRLADHLRDEAPRAYKDIGRVMRAQQELTRIVRRLDPVLVYKGI